METLHQSERRAGPLLSGTSAPTDSRQLEPHLPFHSAILPIACIVQCGRPVLHHPSPCLASNLLVCRRCRLTPPSSLSICPSKVPPTGPTGYLHNLTVDLTRIASVLFAGQHLELLFVLVLSRLELVDIWTSTCTKEQAPPSSPSPVPSQSILYNILPAASSSPLLCALPSIVSGSVVVLITPRPALLSPPCPAPVSLWPKQRRRNSP